jgi:hypothetical protein
LSHKESSYGCLKIARQIDQFIRQFHRLQDKIDRLRSTDATYYRRLMAASLHASLAPILYSDMTEMSATTSPAFIIPQPRRASTTTASSASGNDAKFAVSTANAVKTMELTGDNESPNATASPSAENNGDAVLNKGDGNAAVASGDGNASGVGKSVSFAPSPASAAQPKHDRQQRRQPQADSFRPEWRRFIKSVDQL